RAGVDLQLAQLRATEAVARQHALHGLADDLLRPPLELLAKRPAAEPARGAPVPGVHLCVELVARGPDPLRVGHHHEVPGVDVRRELRLVLAAKRVGDARGETPEGLPLGVHQVPLALDLAGFRVPGLHRESGGPGVRRRTSVAKPARNSAAPPWEGWRT